MDEQEAVARAEIEVVMQAHCCPNGCFRSTQCVKALNGGPEKAQAAIEALDRHREGK
tara:strand:+ start:41 stop:211 length:171 start_codon:yes stop_codon:yes gene_type:complete